MTDIARKKNASLRHVPVNEMTRSEVTEDGGHERYERARLVRLVIFGHADPKLILVELQMLTFNISRFL